MAQQNGRCCSLFRAKVLISLLAVALGAYILGPPLYWHLVGEAEAGGERHYDCPACECNCEAESFASIELQALGNLSVAAADCSNDDPTWQRSRKVQRLREELQLQLAVAADNKQRSEYAYLDAKKLASQYQKEAEKCNVGMETSEEARERTEAALVAEKKKSALWRQRAHQLGWTEKKVVREAEDVVDPSDMELKVIQVDVEEVRPKELHDPELTLGVSDEVGSTSSSSKIKKSKSTRYGKRKKRSPPAP